MPKFTDTIIIRLKAGNGGRGGLSFHREKFIPWGGPDGGDGGNGGDVYVEADVGFHALSHFFKDRLYNAPNGDPGSGGNKTGKDGTDLTIRVPAGTQVIDVESGVVLADLVIHGSRYLAASGGIGGKGNAFFKSSTNQAPRFAQPGMPGEERRVRLNLKLIADFGLVGLPNAGKSTLLSKITNAKPKIADYPFTTLIPNLGVLRKDDGTVYTIADIPGIIEGAHRGHGLGLSFLRHIERVKAILFMIDITGDDPVYALKLLKSELNTYNELLTSKPYFILLNKADLADDAMIKERIELMHDSNVLAISAETGQNMEKIEDIFTMLMEKNDAS